MGIVVVETFIARPPEEVFAYLRDYSHEAKWQSEHVSQVTVEPPGPARVGTRVRKVRRAGGGKQRFTLEITEMNEQSRRWTDIMLDSPFHGTKGSWEVLPEKGGSRVRLTAHMQASGLWRLLLPVIDRSTRKDLQAEFASLKKTLESAS
ncbi:MAG: SRPBCC family protein [Chloroflexota bacterium]|nr:SRPBCC family protein [Chloroflexota bacterium]MDQ5866811.1 SRPBCC family protein [Chloroflexota bacterium]